MDRFLMTIAGGLTLAALAMWRYRVLCQRDAGCAEAQRREAIQTWEDEGGATLAQRQAAASSVGRAVR